MFPAVQELADDGVPVAVTCRVLDVSISGYHEWRSRRASRRDLEQAYLMAEVREVHAASYGTYGHRRVHAELTMGPRRAVSHGRAERLMRATGLQGVHRRTLRGCTRRDEAATPSANLVERNFTPHARTGSTSRTSPRDRHRDPRGSGLASAVFAFIEGFYTPRRRHSTLGYLSPADYETQHEPRTRGGPLGETAA